MTGPGMAEAPTMDEPRIAYPPRYWWLKRICAGCVLLLAVLAGARAWWGYDADRRMKAAIAAIRARGEPILPEDFQSSPLADADNAVTYLKLAGAAYNPAAEPPVSTNMSYTDAPLPAEWFVVARKAIEGNQASLRHLREARNHRQVDWGVKPTVATVPLIFPRLDQQRALACLLGDSALYEHLNGNDAQAMEQLRDLLAMSDASDQGPFVVCHLVSIGIDTLGMHRLALIATRLRVADDPSPAPATKPVTPAQRSQVREMIALLLDSAKNKQLGRALAAERAMLVADLEPNFSRGRLLSPMYTHLGIQAMNRYGQLIASSAQPTLNAAIAPIMPLPTAPLANWTLGIGPQSLVRIVNGDFRVRTERHLTAVSLAARLYRIDHGGQWPPNLQALVPQYLPSVPIDPMSPTGKPLGYLLAKHGTRPVIYSVGIDGHDDTPDESVLPAEPQYEHWANRKDEWRDLSYFEPPPPATQATEE